MTDAESEQEIAVEASAYPDTVCEDEQRRAFVLECMTSCGDAPSIDGRVFVANLELVCQWLKSGAAAAATEKPKRALKAVEP